MFLTYADIIDEDLDEAGDVLISEEKLFSLNKIGHVTLIIETPGEEASSYSETTESGHQSSLHLSRSTVDCPDVNTAQDHLHQPG